jgi:hypothetical protein
VVTPLLTSNHLDPHRRLRAMATMIGAVAVFSGMDALLKFFSQYYPPMEVAVLRGLA